ncbi:MAG: hypothetical protein WCO42_01700 [bacterium]
MKTIMKVCGVVVAVTLAGSVSMAQYRGDYHGGRDGGGHYDRGRSYYGHNDGGRHYGYYRSASGDLIFGLLGIGVLAAVVSSIERPAPVYVQESVVVRQTPQVIYVQQPVQVEIPRPMTMTVNIQNSNGSFTPVTLRQSGSQWVGPKGEYYDNMPSVGQLRPVYGF